MAFHFSLMCKVAMLLSCLLMLMPGCTAVQYKLYNGNNTAGLLHVFNDDGVDLGTICGTLDVNAATIACSSFLPGYVGKVIDATPFGIGYGPIALSNAKCPTPFLADLDLCTYSTGADIKCGHSQDVAISCSLPTLGISGGSLTLLSRGDDFSRIAYYATNSSPSPNGFAICVGSQYSDAAAIASAVCRGMRPDYISARTYNLLNSVSPFTPPELLVITQCSPTDNTTLSNCSGAVANSSTCYGILQIMFCNFVEYEARLTNVTADNIGLVEVRPSANYPWGTICNKNVTYIARSANAMCRLAGFAGMVGTVVTRPSTVPATPEAPYVSSIYCPSWATSTTDCEGAMDLTGCTADMNVYLKCTLPVTPSASTWEFKADSLDKFGTMFVRPNASVPWGVVASYIGDEHIIGAAACRSLGYWYAEVNVDLTSTSAVPGYMLNVECNAAARNLSQCLFQLGSASVTNAPRVACYRYQVVPSISDGTLSARTEYGGLLQLLAQGVSGYVCLDSSVTKEQALGTLRQFFPWANCGHDESIWPRVPKPNPILAGQLHALWRKFVLYSEQT